MRSGVSSVSSLLAALALSASLCGAVHAQGFAALVSPPRFELSTKPGKTLRSVIEISNRSTAPGKVCGAHGGLGPLGGFQREFPR